MYVKRREAEAKVSKALDLAPAVVLLGPRQVGKSTLAKRVARARAASSIYLDLERESDRVKLGEQGEYLRQNPGKLIILDEIHRAPALFMELRGVIDELRESGHRTGQFLLLGSASLDLMNQASESLAGRVAYIDLDPISIEEAMGAGLSVESLWVRGGFPDSLLCRNDSASFHWREEFIRSYLERDVPMFAPRIPSSLIGRLWTMLAHNQGSTLNQTKLAQGLGLTVPTAGRYIDLLDDLHLIRRLPPWFANVGKRIIKTPKVYLRDSGIVHALLEIDTIHRLLGHPVQGPSWEGFVIENLIHAAGPRNRPYFYRTADGAEIDLLFEHAGKPEVAIEIKRATAPKVDRGFHIACDDLDIRHRIVVSGGDEVYTMRGGVTVAPVEAAIGLVRNLLRPPAAKKRTRTAGT
jgi:predicted AAA+ superfamily ATPase